MRCPKCHYIAFDGGERCRNCGYDFSLAIDVSESELELQEEPEGPLTDFSLNITDEATPAATREPESESTSEPETQPAESPAGAELPLFLNGETDGRARVKPSLTPRPPLAVRRATPTIPRLHERPAEPPRLHWDAETTVPAAEPQATPPPEVAAGPRTAEVYRIAGGRRRVLAALIDVVILGGIDFAVLYFTLQLSGLAWPEVALLPWAPFVTFLVLLNGAYLVAFTAAVGQSIGKMALGLRVVSVGPNEGALPSARQAMIRAAVEILSLLPLGVGLLPALMADDRRALHDHAARTRVVELA